MFGSSRFSPRRPKAIALAVVLALALTVGGCGDDESGNTSTDEQPLKKEALPVIQVGVEVDKGGAGPPPLTLNFKADAAGAEGPFLFHWAFDDGTTSTEQNPTHTFSQPGIYNVILNVRNLKGETVRRGAVAGVWPNAEWASGQSKTQNITSAEIRRRQRLQLTRIQRLHAALAAKLRKQLRAEARSAN
jgi:hypothetical protein